MRGICSISSCQFEGEGSKVHEAFEGVKELTICWDCGDKILNGFCTFDEFKLREQIAREIEGLICTTRHPTIQVQYICDGEKYAYSRAANIARGK